MEINQAVNELNSLFSKYGVKGWKLNEVSSAYSAKIMLNKFGGMGSLNDLYICKENGHNIQSGEESTVNQKVTELLNEVYKGCKLLVRS